MVLAGGPDRERPVSLKSGAAVAAALRQAGHEVLERDILPDNLAALDEFDRWKGQVVFPALHGQWSEGGGLQAILDGRGVHYVGCRAAAARLCMDKLQTKTLLQDRGLPTPRWQVLTSGKHCELTPPLVLKPPCEGSSIDVAICRDALQVGQARARLQIQHEQLLAEAFVAGKEMTVGVLETPPGAPGIPGTPGLPGQARLQALPPIQILPATEFYDYQAKYDRDDTRYLLDPAAIGLSTEVYDQLGILAMATHQALGCRHMSRVDIMVDENSQPWVLEVNTIPGFTSHSLLPMAAAHSGLPMPALVDRLVRLAAGNGRA
jgi:D-alanine-D-alanine ligase